MTGAGVSHAFSSSVYSYIHLWCESP